MPKKAQIKIGSDEGEVQSSICEYLVLKRIVFWRQNNFPPADLKGGFYRKMPPYSVKGVSDIIAIKNGKAYFLEVKDQAKQSKDQKTFEEMVTRGGAVYAVVRSIDDVIKLGL
jgi:hypothetical protein